MQVFGCANSNSTGFEVVYSDVSEFWAICMHYLEKLIIIGLLLEYFAALLKILHLKKLATKIFQISLPIVLFSYGKVKEIFRDKDQISSGEDKRKG